MNDANTRKMIKQFYESASGRPTPPGWPSSRYGRSQTVHVAEVGHEPVERHVDRPPATRTPSSW
jgi:hypothetical protein